MTKGIVAAMSARGMRSTGRSLEALIPPLQELSAKAQFKPITERLLPVVRFVVGSDCPASDMHRLAQDIEIMIASVPEIGPEQKRVLFDVGLIQATVDAWGAAGVPLSRMVFPNYGCEWNHKHLPLPSMDRKAVPRLDLIGFPGGEDLEDVSLVDYAWIYHELGHILLRAHGEWFCNHFDSQINAFVKAQKLRALADSDLNKKRAESVLDRLLGFWSPGESAWSNEIACDIIALWTSGPAFLQAFLDTMDDREPDPYYLGESHPPYEVRAFALVEAAERLGWNGDIANIQDRIDAWRISPAAKARTNEYVTLTDADIVKSAVSSSIEFCRECGLEACDKDRLKAVEGLLQVDNALDFGPELVLAAWLLRGQDSVDSCQAWERKLVQALAGTVML